VLLRTLPVKEPERLAFLYHPGPVQGSSSTSEQGGPAFSYPMFREMQSQQTAFTGLAGTYAVAASAAYNNTARMGARCSVSGNTSSCSASARRWDGCSTRTTIAIDGGHPLVVLSLRLLDVEVRRGSRAAQSDHDRQRPRDDRHRRGAEGLQRRDARYRAGPLHPDQHEEGDDARLGCPEGSQGLLGHPVRPPQTGSTLEQAQTAINITYQPQLQQDIALCRR
jgi:hypothetical protein